MTDHTGAPGVSPPKVVTKLPNARRSDRVAIELAVQVSGKDRWGKRFVEDTVTAVVSRHGAKIPLSCALTPGQELTLRCVKTGKESGIRVVGQIGEAEGGLSYGVALLDHNVNLWDIEFPPITDSGRAVARALMACGVCQTQELVYLDEFEAEVFESNRSLSRRCNRCAQTTLWKQSVPGSSAEPAPQPDKAETPKAPRVKPARTENERKEIRVGLRMQACIRSKECGEEVVTTENISRGGMSFKSVYLYAVGTSVEVAIPYARGATNVFSTAQIVHAQHFPAQGLTLYGVANVIQLLYE